MFGKEDYQAMWLPLKNKCRAGGAAQVVASLPSKCQTLSSNWSITKQTKYKSSYILLWVFSLGRWCAFYYSDTAVNFWTSWNCLLCAGYIFAFVQWLYIFIFLRYFDLDFGNSRCCAAWAMPPLHLALVMLEMGLLNYFPTWLWTSVLPVSASWVAGIIGVSHLHPALVVF
jgi:hypothetical protein